MMFQKKILSLIVTCTLAASMLAGCSNFLVGGSSPLDAKLNAASSVDSAESAAEVPYGNDALMPPDPYYTGNTEEYSSFEETGFVSTAARPLSTFSADVDTASYCNLRRMAAEGARASDIPTGAVRIEEMLNYFDYDYPLPERDDLFGVTSQIADCPWNPDSKLLIMGFATEPAAYESTVGANLVFLIDTSGSMGTSDKLPLLQDAFAELVEGLSENDCVSIVTYSGAERVVLEGASGADKRAITRAVDSLVADGSTNGEAGLEKAYRIAERYYREGGVNRIVMASDGDLNVGMSSESDLHDYVSEKRKTGIYLSVLGFGSGNYKDNKMETLADHGNGTYCYIDCIEEAEKAFGEDLCANIVPLADDVKLQIEFNPAAIKGYRLIGYQNRMLADEDFQDDSADAGEIGAGHQFTIAYELVMADSPMDIPVPDLKYGSQGAREPGSERDGESGSERDADSLRGENDEWLTCSMRYKPAGSQKSIERAYPVGSESYTTRPSDDWTFASAVIECGMVLQNSPYAGSASLRDARRTVEALDFARDDPKAGFERLLTSL